MIQIIRDETHLSDSNIDSFIDELEKQAEETNITTKVVIVEDEKSMSDIDKSVPTIIAEPFSCILPSELKGNTLNAITSKLILKLTTDYEPSNVVILSNNSILHPSLSEGLMKQGHTVILCNNEKSVRSFLPIANILISASDEPVSTYPYWHNCIIDITGSIVEEIGKRIAYYSKEDIRGKIINEILGSD